jgi:RNA polymerase sigma-70 factor (ECF subfamily)
MSQSDGELVARVLRGDLTSYAELLRRHRRRLERYAMFLLGNREDAEEALQDALLRGYRALGQCAEPERFGAWLFRIVVNRCRTRHARRGRPLERLDTIAAIDVPATPDPSAGIEWREEIRRAMALLQTDQREAFLLHHVEGLSYEEMAELTGSGVSALKMRVSRAGERLRTELAEVFRA